MTLKTVFFPIRWCGWWIHYTKVTCLMKRNTDCKYITNLTTLSMSVVLSRFLADILNDFAVLFLKCNLSSCKKHKAKAFLSGCYFVILNIMVKLWPVVTLFFRFSESQYIFFWLVTVNGENLLFFRRCSAISVGTHATGSAPMDAGILQIKRASTLCWTSTI